MSKNPELQWFEAVNFRGDSRMEITAHNEKMALLKAKRMGLIAPVVSPIFLSGKDHMKYFSNLEWLDRKIAMKPPIDFSMLNNSYPAHSH